MLIKSMTARARIKDPAPRRSYDTMHDLGTIGQCDFGCRRKMSTGLGVIGRASGTCAVQFANGTLMSSWNAAYNASMSSSLLTSSNITTAVRMHRVSCTLPENRFKCWWVVL